MGMTLHVDIVSAEKKIYSGRAEMVCATGAIGELGITPGHSQLLSELKPGVVRLKIDEEREEVFYIAGGFLEVQPHLVTVLASTAEHAKDLDEAKALDAMDKAKKLLDGKQAEIDYAYALQEVARAAAQIRAIKNIRDILKK